MHKERLPSSRKDRIGDDLFLTVNDVARLCGVAVRTIYNWKEQERIPKPIRIGRRCLWNRSKFLNFMEGLAKES